MAAKPTTKPAEPDQDALLRAIAKVNGHPDPKAFAAAVREALGAE